MDRPVSCHLCVNFIGDGMHFLTGRCGMSELSIAYDGYRETASSCLSYRTEFRSCCEDCKARCQDANPYMVSCSSEWS